ncbi:MAG TPA: PqqD family protein [Jatrophihabitans sp.]|nr:PqqD family protein [Jatrophihabitans sp.]
MCVNTRIADSVTDIAEQVAGGALVETMLGRYALDQDARRVWLLIDGHRTVADIADEVATATGLSAAEVAEPVRSFCAQLTDLRLAELTAVAS